jgi:hypothetical protein
MLGLVMWRPYRLKGSLQPPSRRTLLRLLLVFAESNSSPLTINSAFTALSLSVHLIGMATNVLLPVPSFDSWNDVGGNRFMDCSSFVTPVPLHTFQSSILLYLLLTLTYILNKDLSGVFHLSDSFLSSLWVHDRSRYSHGPPWLLCVSVSQILSLVLKGRYISGFPKNRSAGRDVSSPPTPLFDESILLR